MSNGRGQQTSAGKGDRHRGVDVSRYTIPVCATEPVPISREPCAVVVWGLMVAVLFGPWVATVCSQTVLPAESFPIQEPGVAMPFVGEIGPAVDLSPTPGPAGTLSSGPLPGPNDEDYDPDRPRDARSGFFQGLSAQATWLAGGQGPSQLGVSDIELYSVFAVPLPKKSWPLLITPTFDTYLMQVPRSIDLPARLYDGILELSWIPRLSPEWRLNVTADPGVYSDFQEGTAKGIRVPAHAAAIYTWSPTTKIVFGAAYLDRRSGSDVLPIGGVVWKPRDDLSFELVLPRPKIGWRIDPGGTADDDLQHWIYVAGEWGGDTWEIRRSSGVDEQVSYSDYRVLLGFERLAMGGPKLRFETGYIFGRELCYPGLPHVEPSPTLLLRAGATF